MNDMNTPEIGKEPTGYYSFSSLFPNRTSSTSDLCDVQELSPEGGALKDSKILICPDCQSQTEVVVRTQKSPFARAIRMSLIFTVVLSCFSFHPCLPEGIKVYEYRCVSCKKLVASARGSKNGKDKHENCVN